MKVLQGGQFNPNEQEGCRGNAGSNGRAVQKPAGQCPQQATHGDGRTHPGGPPGQSSALTDQTADEVEKQPPTAAPTPLSNGAHRQQSD